MTAISLNFSVTTMDNNLTDVGEQVVEQSYVTIRRIQTVMIPIICVIGIVGNTLAAGAFFSAQLRTISCCLYLGVKCLSDIGFLVSLFVVWLYRVHVPIFSLNVICQTTIFLSYICAFSSVWLVVIITFENFIRISQPRLVPVICTSRTGKIVIISCTVISLLLYNFPLWTTGIVKDAHGTYCSTYSEFKQATVILTYIDTMLTLVLPFFLMVILVVLITIAAIQAYERKKRLFMNLIRPIKKGKSPEAQVTKMLFAVSIVFLVLHTPIHGIRIKLMILEVFQNGHVSTNDYIFQRFFELLYYIDFCISLAVYLIFGDNFKKVFIRMYFKRCCPVPTGDVDENHMTNHISISTTSRGVDV